MAHRRSIIVVLLVAIVVAIAVVRSAFVHGTFRSLRIGSGSMAQTLLGPHYLVMCADCQLPFHCGVDAPPIEHSAVCPNCGFRQNEFGLAELQNGVLVSVDTWPYWWTSPSRWDIVAFTGQTEEPNDSWLVKRIVGLPGEQLAIRHGNLFVNDQLITRPHWLVRQQQILVHDNNHQPTLKKLPARWRRRSDTSSWIDNREAFVFRPGSSDNLQQTGDSVEPPNLGDSIDWLSYHHWACVLDAGHRTDDAVILDNDSYNQGTSRQLFPVDELILEFDVQIREPGELLFRFLSNGCEWILAVDVAQRRATLTSDGAVCASSTVEVERLRGRHRWEVAVVDGQFVWSIDRSACLQHCFEVRTVSESLQPVSIGARRGEVEISGIKLFRDIYYLSPSEIAPTWKSERLPNDAYLLLGDNPSGSEDSRMWGVESVRRRQIIGIVHPK